MSSCSVFSLRAGTELQAPYYLLAARISTVFCSAWNLNFSTLCSIWSVSFWGEPWMFYSYSLPHPPGKNMDASAPDLGWGQKPISLTEEVMFYEWNSRRRKPLVFLVSSPVMEPLLYTWSGARMIRTRYSRPCLIKNFPMTREWRVGGRGPQFLCHFWLE